jgi:exopolysaccharide biosynthesis polyprenyl glycosylphosphotransferase
MASTAQHANEKIASVSQSSRTNRPFIMRPQPIIRILHGYFPARTVLLALSELLMMFAALIAATYARYGQESTLLLFYESGWVRIAIVCAVCLLCLYYYELYDSVVLASGREVFIRQVQVVGTACIILAVLYYLRPSIQIRSSLFVPAVLFMGACLVGWRRLFSLVNSSPSLGVKTALLGAGPLALSLAKELVGLLADADEASSGWTKFLRMGDPDEVLEIVAGERIDRLIVAMGNRRGKLPIEQLLELKAQGVIVEDGSDFYETLAGKIPLESLRPSQLVFGPGFFVNGSLLFYKRVSSILISLICLIPALPLMGLTALAIWFDSGAPILFRQKRVGKAGKIFTLYKFRSMRTEGNGNANGNGKVQPALEDDKRITRVGRWIRRLRIDELPQLYNVLRGDMHFVGPRPFMVEEEEELARQIPFYKYRWVTKPGVTGWAQIHRPYCATLEDNQDKLSYDLFYIKHMSVGLDLLILFKTVKILLWRRGAR